MLLASFSIVIGLSTALWVGAEYLTTVPDRAADSIFSHAFSCFSSYRLVIIVSGIQVNITLNYFHDIAAAARNEIRILSHKLGLNDFLKLLIIFAHVITELPVLNLLPTSLLRTNNIFGLFNLNDCSLCQAIPMNQVEAIG